VRGRRGRRCRKLLDDLKERRGYSHLKEEALDCTMWRACHGRGFGPVVDEWMNEWMWWFKVFTVLWLLVLHCSAIKWHSIVNTGWKIQHRIVNILNYYMIKPHLFTSLQNLLTPGQQAQWSERLSYAWASGNPNFTVNITILAAYYCLLNSYWHTIPNVHMSRHM